jgi:hypothetical protein
MKKYIFIAVAGLLALSSCSNDDNEELNVKNTPRQMTFNAGYVADAAKTRATLDFSSKKVKFDNEDAISILSANNTNQKFTTSGAGYGDKATFTGTAVDDTKFYSVYPYTNDLTLGVDVTTTTINNIVIPASQWNSVWASSGNNGWDPKAPIAWAETTDENLHFYNLCAILRIQTTGSGFSEITISANEALAGTFDLRINTSTSTAALATTASSTTSVTTTSPVAAGNDLYIAIAPGTKTNFSVVSTGTNKKKASITFQAGYVYNLGEFSVN